jgi:parvulin-like peptidyl-prolyl isomerase
MSFRGRRPARSGVRTRLGRLFDTEERQQATVTLLFAVAIVAVVLTLIGSVALAWYNDNLRPLARVGSVEIGPQLARDHANLILWRIGRDESRVQQAQINGEIDADTARARLQALAQAREDLPTSGLENLIDTIFQSQLAPAEGITTTAADVDERLNTEVAALEKRHVLEITVKPAVSDPDSGPSLTERTAALAKAQEALAAVNGGADWATAAHQYSNGDSEPAGGDIGLVTIQKVADSQFAEALFDLELYGTTTVVLGNDGYYHIGRVTEIVPGAEDPGLRDGLFAKVPEASVRQLLGYEEAAGALQDKITDAALAEVPEQVRIAVIYIEGLSADDPSAAGGEVDYSEIVFAPNDQLETAPQLPAEDQAWTKALEDAQAMYDQLAAISDPTERAAKLAELAPENSDSPTGEDGGAVGFVTRDIPPTAVGDALFDGEFAKGDLVGGGPVRGDAAYYVLMFNEFRPSPEDRMQAVRDALAVPGADFNQVARELSEGPEKEEGGEIGWLTKDQLAEDVAEQIFALGPGQVTDPPVELGEGHYFIKVEEKAVRPYDPDQLPEIRASAFSDWYQEKKAAAEENDTIVRADETDTTDGGAGDDLVPEE